ASGSLPDLYLHPGEAVPVTGPAAVELEDGAIVPLSSPLPLSLPFGYHHLSDRGGRRRLVVSPSRVPAPPFSKGWGWAVQIYSARSRQSWGIGDLNDLRSVAEWAAASGAAAISVSPLHAGGAQAPREPSPYFPSSRIWREPLHLHVGSVPGAARLGAQMAGLAAAGTELNRSPLIDRDKVAGLKMDALQRIWAAARPPAELAAWVRAEGRPLADWSIFSALAEIHGLDWRLWPEGLRHPRSPDVSRQAVQLADRIAFHSWLQWLLAEQAKAASRALPLVHDLAVGSRPDGADVWRWQDLAQLGFSLGAPPDEFNREGQVWGVTPFDPNRLLDSGLEPIREMLSSALRHAGGIRIDHVMGLFRQFWIPAGKEPQEGVYVRFPYRQLLDVVALEARRAGAFVVGEDLGTVEGEVRLQLRQRGMFGYRLLWFDESPEGWPEESIGARGTHDRPTMAGVWKGIDGNPEIRERVAKEAGLSGSEPTREAWLKCLAALARSPSRLLLAQLEDLLEMEERPNRPGAEKGGPSWRLALPRPLEEILQEEGTDDVSQVLRRD
ncbi:MAG TPA: 4-alpha-glucanotransferase, partial [Candidatus Saccharimonadales bacterium]|nr:4-alpha-glucanotransferase [Candidatus Saccharimonadales bacterium]